MPISPTVVRAKTKLALPDQTRRSTATSSTCHLSHRACRRLSLAALELLPVALQVLQAAAEEERLLGHVVELALGDLVERLDGLLIGTVEPGWPVNCSATQQVLRQEALDPPGPADELSLSSSDSSSMPRMAMMSCRSLYRCRIRFTSLRDAVVLVADVLRVEDPRGRGQRVHRRVDALLGDRAGELGGGVEVRERGGRRRVGVVVGGHVDRLHRGDRPAAGRGDPLLQLAHLVGQRRLVAHGRRHPAEQRGDLGAGLGEPEDVVDEQQHVLVLHVAEVLRHGQRRTARPASGCPAARPSDRRPARCRR